MNVGGIVLCGGRSRRMGRPKAWLPFNGELLLPRIVRILSDVVAPIVVVAAQGQELPPLPPPILVARDPAPERGPLQGLAAGLAALNGLADAAYVSSCDVPFLRAAFIRRMIELTGASAVCVPHIEGFAHPLAGIYRLNILPIVQEHLAMNQLRLSSLLGVVPTRLVGAAELADVDPTLECLRNLNTPEEFEAAQAEPEA